ncbi:putative Polycomb group protein ASXL2 isoform X2 [Hemicordylus capensis]|uniref:putative Polycomb group protein ASXL2 isoform X2 n=1 Tax=Hemicordylus capensis TaxID=884348 RepID=UPI0023047FF1|nr:putative Polycomb group protein ASXL2 isoform X2 [Hemicordylus capensis]
MYREQLPPGPLRVSTRLSQVSSPQPGCPSPSIPPGKVISSSQKLSKKALKQALKQKQRKQQQCRASGSVSSSHHLLQPQQQQAKATSHPAPAKPAWEGKHSDGHSSSSQNSTSSSSPSVKAEPSLSVLGKKPFQRADRLHARQLKRARGAEIDVETPDSILVNTNLRALINKHMFSVLPPNCQHRLLLLLPEVDRQVGLDGLMKLSSSALNNEFFTSAAQGWKERLSEGEFTPEMQLRLRQEREKEKKAELWKEHFFESYYGQSSGLSPEEAKQLTSFPTAAQALAGDPALPPLEQCVPAPLAGPGQEEAPTALVGPQDLPVPPAAGKGEGDEKPPAPMPTELATSSDNSALATAGSRPPHKPSQGAKEPTQGEPAGEASGKEHASRPKSPVAAAAGIEPGPGEEAPESPAKDAPGPEQMEVGAPGLKRKLESPEEASTMPEKRPHVTENCCSRPPFQSPPQPFPAAPVPKVPPLRIPVSRIHGSPPAPFPASQVSPRPTFPGTVTSPRRTGARTLADIKARAQMARAQRAAAAAAEAAAASSAATAASIAGAIPGPGPGGGRGEEKSGPAPGTRPHGAALDLAGPGLRAAPPRPWPPCPGARAPAAEPGVPSGPARAQLQPASPLGPCPAAPRPVAASAAQGAKALLPGRGGGLGGAPPTSSQASRAAGQPEPRTDCREATPAAPSSPRRAPAPPRLSPLPAGSVACGLQAPAVSSGSSSRSTFPPKMSASIPANNPLVSQLLQGKEVPLEQILPRPLTRVEVKSVPLQAADGKEPSAPARPGPPREASGKQPSLGEKPCSSQGRQQLPPPPSPFLGQDLWGRQAVGKGAPEPLLPPLMPRGPRQSLPPALQPLPPPGLLLESCSTSQSFMLGFTGRRTSKPAMSGHYLLNVSTYGRGSDSLRRNLAVPPESRMCPDGPRMALEGREEAPGGSGSSGEEGSEDGEGCIPLEEEETPPPLTPEAGAARAAKLEQAGGSRPSSASQDLLRSPTAKDFLQAAQEKVAQVARGRGTWPHSVELPTGSPADSLPPRLLSPLHPSRLFGSPATTQLLGPGYSGTINVSTSPEMQQEALLSGLSDPSGMGDVVSFSVTVTAIPAGPPGSTGSHRQPLPGQAFSQEGSLEDLPSKCYCRLKAMIVCKGCGAFCHDDCIGPSRLCVSCLVVR